MHEHVDDDASVRTIIVTHGVGPPWRGLVLAEIDPDCGVGAPRKTQPLHLRHLDHDSFEMGTERTGFDDQASGDVGTQWRRAGGHGGSPQSASRAFSITSGSAGWIQYWPRAMSWAPSPKLIAWMSDWINDDA